MQRFAVGREKVLDRGGTRFVQTDVQVNGLGLRSRQRFGHGGGWLEYGVRNSFGSQEIKDSHA